MRKLSENERKSQNTSYLDLIASYISFFFLILVCDHGRMHLRTPVKGSVRLATGAALLTKLPLSVADVWVL